MEKVAMIHPDGIVDRGLSDHESLEPVPVQLTGNCHYLQCARIMSEFAELMGDSSAKEKYEILADSLKAYLRAEFWDRPRPEKINRQTLFSALLYHEVVPASEIHAARDSLLQALKNGPSEHFNTGIFGTKYVLEALSEYESPERVYEIVNSTEYPGWGYMIDRGASTIWETWRESDNTYSNNHPMFGTVTEWFYRWLAGIRPDPEFPGFEEFVLNPATPVGLDSVNCSYHSPYGQIISNWKREDQNNILYTMKIPEGSTARVNLGLGTEQTIEIQRKGKPVGRDKISGMQTGRFTLDAGEFRIRVSNRE